jgi:hypothetical protein
MSEVQIGGGDSVSRLLQVHAKEIGVKKVWSGDGRKDSRDVIVDLYNMTKLKDALWKGLQELYAMPEMKELPEIIQVKLMAVILNARACAELETKA